MKYPNSITVKNRTARFSSMTDAGTVRDHLEEIGVKYSSSSSIPVSDVHNLGLTKITDWLLGETDKMPESNTVIFLQS